MTYAEIKQAVPALTKGERLDLAHLLLHLSLRDDPEYLAELDRGMADMDAGKKVTQEEVERMHQELLAQGR
jgi:predicted transcriptional regulator